MAHKYKSIYKLKILGGITTALVFGVVGTNLIFTSHASQLLGDANSDGVVNIIDLSILASNWNTTSGATWSMGDFNSDGVVNIVDLSILASHWGDTLTGLPATPSSLSANATSSTTVNLSWNADSNSNGTVTYLIYRNGTQITTTTATSYSNSGLTANTIYSYSIAAQNNNGTSSQTSSINVTTPAQTTDIAVGIAVDDSNQSNNNQISNYVGAVGTSPNFVQWYQSWSEPLYYSSQESSVTSNHLTPVISWTSDATSLTSISDGSQNTTLDAAATLAKQWPGTLYIRFDYEMNISSSEWYPANLGETPANFVAAWQYVVNRFSTDGVTNVKWIWSPNVNCNGSCPFDSYFPGDSYVNMVGLDGYNYAWVDNVDWESFADLFQNSYNDIVALAPGKPVDIAETASAEANSSETSSGDSKATWIQQMSSYIPSNMPAVTSITWWSAAADQATLEVNSSTASLAAWKDDVVTNPTYSGTLP